MKLIIQYLACFLFSLIRICFFIVMHSCTFYREVFGGTAHYSKIDGECVDLGQEKVISIFQALIVIAMKSRLVTEGIS